MFGKFRFLGNIEFYERPLTGLTWKDQNLGRKVEVRYMNKPCNELHLALFGNDIEL